MEKMAIPETAVGMKIFSLADLFVSFKARDHGMVPTNPTNQTKGTKFCRNRKADAEKASSGDCTRSVNAIVFEASGIGWSGFLKLQDKT